MFLGRLIALVLLSTGWGSGQVRAQEDLNRGKTPAQLFASDCADCHRNPRGLAKRDAGSLAGYLRVHYTASRESAAAIAAYLISLGPDPRGSRPAAARRRPAASQPAQPAAKPGEAAVPKPPEPVPDAPLPAAPGAANAGEPPAPATPPAAPANPQ